MAGTAPSTGAHKRKPARTALASGQRHIRRVDDAERSRTHAWLVQVQRRNRIVIRMFSDGRHGGRRAVLAAALAFRAAMLKQMHDPGYALWRRNRKRRNNTSGIVGVARYANRERARPGRKPIEREYWQAFADDGKGARRSRKFSVAKYGEMRARALAIRARRALLREVGAQAAT